MQNKYPNKYTSFTKEDIYKYLGELNQIIQQGRYQISTNRNKNYEFIIKYNIKSNISKSMLLQLDTYDFCYAEDNNKINGEILYVFAKDYELNDWGTIERIKVYIKINEIITNDNRGYAFIVSFHEAERNIDFLFK